MRASPISLFRGSQSLVRLVYASMSLLLIASIAILLVGDLVFHWKWPNNWMPNFIAEWSGIFIAAFAVERLLDLDRKRREALKLAPLQALAGDALATALIPVFEHLLRVWPDQLTSNVDGVAQRVIQRVFDLLSSKEVLMPAPSAAQIREWAATLHRTATEIGSLRERYSLVLGADLAMVYDIQNGIEYEAGYIDGAIEQADSEEELQRSFPRAWGFSTDSFDSVTSLYTRLTGDDVQFAAALIRPIHDLAGDEFQRALQRALRS
jgi:hypothetical protein